MTRNSRGPIGLYTAISAWLFSSSVRPLHVALQHRREIDTFDRLSLHLQNNDITAYNSSENVSVSVQNVIYSAWSSIYAYDLFVVVEFHIQ